MNDTSCLRRTPTSRFRYPHIPSWPIGGNGRVFQSRQGVEESDAEDEDDVYVPQPRPPRPHPPTPSSSRLPLDPSAPTPGPSSIPNDPQPGKTKKDKDKKKKDKVAVDSDDESCVSEQSDGYDADVDCSPLEGLGTTTQQESSETDNLFSKSVRIYYLQF